MSNPPSPIVSIVVPVYNAENYLAECLDSLLAQSFQDFELICVDNESTDSSMELLGRYADQDPRVHVDSCPGNAGSARNRGLDKARGECLLFLDSDDFFADDMLQRLVTAYKRSRADIILFGGRRFDDKTKRLSDDVEFLNRDLLPKSAVFSYADVPDDLFQLTNPAPWGRMYKRKFLQENGVRFQELDNTNDWAFTYTAMMLADGITAVDGDFARYRTNVDTSIQGRKREAPLCCVQAIYAVHDKLVERGRYEVLRKSFEHQALSLLEFFIYSVADAGARSRIFAEMESDRFRTLDLLGKEAGEYKSSHTYEISRSLLDMIALNRKLYGAQEPCGFSLVAGSPEPPADAKVSVIIPVFNTEAYLREALDSVLGQTLQEIEVICIDDGSTDGSRAILEEYAAEDDRMRVYGQANSGLSKTRNNGISVASGEYILFMDSDDAIEADALRQLYAKVKGESLDICFFDASSFSEEGMAQVCAEYDEYYKRSKAYDDVCSGVDLMIELFANADYLPSACMYLVCRAFIEVQGISFHEGILHEDNAFTFHCLIRAQRVSHSNNAFYRRRVRGGSITRTLSFDHVYGYFACYVDMMRLVSALGENGISADAYGDILGILALTLNNAQKDYFALPLPQREVRFGLSPAEERLFVNLIDTPLGRCNEARIHGLERENHELRQRVEWLERSHSYRVGKTMIAPARALRKALKK